MLGATRESLKATNSKAPLATFNPKTQPKAKDYQWHHCLLRPNRKKDDFENGEYIQINIDETMLVAN